MTEENDKTIINEDKTPVVPKEVPKENPKTPEEDSSIKNLIQEVEQEMLAEQKAAEQETQQSALQDKKSLLKELMKEMQRTKETTTTDVNTIIEKQNATIEELKNQVNVLGTMSKSPDTNINNPFQQEKKPEPSKNEIAKAWVTQLANGKRV